MKKLISYMLIFVAVVNLMACGSKDENNKSEKNTGASDNVETTTKLVVDNEISDVSDDSSNTDNADDTGNAEDNTTSIKIAETSNDNDNTTTISESITTTNTTETTTSKIEETSTSAPIITETTGWKPEWAKAFYDWMLVDVLVSDPRGFDHGIPANLVDEVYNICDKYMPWTEDEFEQIAQEISDLTYIEDCKCRVCNDVATNGYTCDFYYNFFADDGKGGNIYEGRIGYDYDTFLSLSNLTSILRNPKCLAVSYYKWDVIDITEEEINSILSETSPEAQAKYDEMHSPIWYPDSKLVGDVFFDCMMYQTGDGNIEHPYFQCVTFFGDELRTNLVNGPEVDDWSGISIYTIKGSGLEALINGYNEFFATNRKVLLDIVSYDPAGLGGRCHGGAFFYTNCYYDATTDTTKLYICNGSKRCYN